MENCELVDLSINSVPKATNNFVKEIPKELWLMILGYLPTSDILKRVSLVSKFFNHLSKDCYLIKTLKIGVITKLDYPFVQALLNRSKGLIKVEFEGFLYAKALQLVSFLLDRNKNVKELILHQHHTTIDTSILCELGKNMEKLEILDPKQYLNGQHLAKMPNLKVLKTQLKCPIALFHLAKGCESLEHLDFICHDFLDADNDTMKSAFKLFFEKVQYNLKVFSIDFTGDHPDEAEDSKIRFRDCFEFLSLCQDLEEIAISSIPLSSNDIISLTKLPNLKKLSISRIRMPVDFITLFAKIQKQKLVELNFQYSFLTQDALMELTKNEGCPNLIKLGLDGNRGLNVSTELLKAFINNCPKFNHITMLGFVKKSICPEYLHELRNEGRVKIEPNSDFWLRIPEPVVITKDYFSTDEIWKKIFKYLPYSDIISNVRFVSSKFRFLVRDFNLTTNTLELNSNNAEILKTFTNFTKLIFGSSDSSILAKILKTNKNLKSLKLLGKLEIGQQIVNNFHGIHQGDSSMLDLLEQVAKSGDHIEHLAVDNFSIGCLKIIAKLNYLKFLTVGKYNEFTPQELKDMALKCVNLEYLQIQYFETQEDFREAFKMLFENRSLKTLQISGKDFFLEEFDLDEGVTDQELIDEISDVRGCFEFLHLCKSVKELHLDSLMIDVEDAKGIAKMSNLKILKLTCVYGTEDCFDLLFKNMDLTNIEVIDLRESRITEKNLKDILAQGCPNLEKLYVNNFKSLNMSNNTFKLLVENHPKLKLLSLKNVVEKVSDEYLYKIISEDKCRILLDGSRRSILKKYERYHFPSNNFISGPFMICGPSLKQNLDGESSGDEEFSENEMSSVEENLTGDEI